MLSMVSLPVQPQTWRTRPEAPDFAATELEHLLHFGQQASEGMCSMRPPAQSRPIMLNQKRAEPNH